jgi:hypothetical protein
VGRIGEYYSQELSELYKQAESYYREQQAHALDQARAQQQQAARQLSAAMVYINPPAKLSTAARRCAE